MGARESRSSPLNELYIKKGCLYANKPFICDIRKEMSDEVPFARSGHRIVCDEDNFYSYGGYNPLNSERNGWSDTAHEDLQSLFPDVWKYNFANKKWRKLPVKNIPFALASNAVILSGKMLMVYGGTGVPFHIAKSNNLFVCNLANPELRFERIVTTGQIPPPLYGQAAFIRDCYFYVMGGTTGFDYSIDIHRLNLKTKVWEEVYICKGLRNEPYGRYRHELAVVGDKVYILGGGHGMDSYGFEEIQVFDVARGQWEVVPSVKDINHGYPSPRQYHSSIKIPGTNSFIIVGGLQPSGIVLDDAWRLDIDTMEWHNLTLRLCTPVYFHASCVTPAGKMYTFGGISDTIILQERVNHVQSAWVLVPKLKDICWEAVVEYKLVTKESFEDPELKNILPAQYHKRLIY